MTKFLLSNVLVFLIHFCFVIHVFALEIVMKYFGEQYLFYVQVYKIIIKMKSWRSVCHKVNRKLGFYSQNYD